MAVAQPSTEAVPPGDPTRGAAVFKAQQCWACHGYNGETGTALLHDDGTFATRLQNVDRFIAFVRAPRPNDPPPIGSSTSMPSYGAASLPNQQAADLYTYIKTFKPTQPALKDIPLLQQMINEGGHIAR
jgi:mono/diheme cytochrome c family protein